MCFKGTIPNFAEMPYAKLGTVPVVTSSGQLAPEPIERGLDRERANARASS